MRVVVKLGVLLCFGAAVACSAGDSTVVQESVSFSLVAEDSSALDSLATASAGAFTDAGKPIRLVEIDEMVRKQIQDALAARHAEAQARANTEQYVRMAVRLIPGAAIVILLVGAVLGIRAWKRRRRLQREAPTTNLEVPPVARTGYGNTFDTRLRAATRESEPEQKPEDVWEGSPDVDSPKGYKRGSEDLLLTRRFSEGSRELIQNKVQQALSARPTREKARQRLARRLGVGQGELELAMKLRDIEVRDREKEMVP